MVRKEPAKSKKPRESQTALMLLVFVKQIENDADQRQNGRKTGRLQHGQDQIAAADPA